MTARERNAALNAAIDTDRAHGREPDPVSGRPLLGWVRDFAVVAVAPGLVLAAVLLVVAAATR